MGRSPARASLWVDADSGMIVAFELNRSLADALETAISRAGGRPASVIVQAVEDTHRLRFAFKDIEVQLGPVEPLEVAWESFVDQVEAGGFEPRYVELDGTAAEVERFFEAMSALHRAAPWTSLEESHYLRLRVEALGIDHVLSVLGAAGVSRGLVVYESVACAERFGRAASHGGGQSLAFGHLGGRVLHLGYARRAELSPAMRKELRANRWSHPRGKAPHVIAIDEDGVIAPVRDDDYRAGVLAAHAVREVMAHLDDLDAGELSLRSSVELPGLGTVPLELSYPVPELVTLDDVLDGPLVYDPGQGPDPERWLATDEGERFAAVLDAHGADEVGDSPRSHAAIHVIVENLVASGELDAAAEGLARLRGQGLSRHDAIHALGSAVASEIFGALTGQREADPDALNAALGSASADAWRASALEPRARRKRAAKRKKKKKRRR